MKNVYHNLIFKKKLEDIKSTEPDLIQSYVLIIELCKNHLFDLRAKVLNKGFLNIRDEIFFFKHTKQEAYALLLYYQELHFLESTINLLDIKGTNKTIKRKLKEIRSFYKENSHFIQYVLLGKCNLDIEYFTRNIDNSKNERSSLFINLDVNFNTSHDLLLAKFGAYKKLESYLYKKLNNYKCNQEISTLRWTASKNALIELIYALYFTRVINNGKASVKEIAKAFESIFEVKINDIYRTLVEIKMRKQRIKFLHQLVLEFQENIKKNDA